MPIFVLGDQTTNHNFCFWGQRPIQFDINFKIPRFTLECHNRYEFRISPLNFQIPLNLMVCYESKSELHHLK